MGPPKLPNESNWGVLNLPPNKQHPAIHFGVPRYHVFRFLQLWRRLKTCPPTVQIPFTLDVFVCPMDTWKATQLAPFLFRSTCNGPHVVVFAFCDTCREDTDGSYGCFQKLGLANVVWWFFIIYNPYGSKHILRRYIIPPKSYPKHFLRKHGWIHRE